MKETDMVTDTAQAKIKLAAGGVSPGHVDEFCRVLGQRLNPQLEPLGFLMAFELLIIDMETARGRSIGNPPITSYVAGLPIGGVMRLALPRIVKHAFAEDFAEAVIIEWQSICVEASRG